VDARLHQLQGEAELVTDPLALLQEFYRDKLTAFLRHQAGARLIGQYDFNNTYQYIINREDVQLSWIRAAIVGLGATASDEVAERGRGGRGSSQDVAAAIIAEDAAEAQAFVDRWRPRVEAMTNTPHRGMLRVVLGETLEQRRFFEQALAGDVDLLGRRSSGVGARVGHVLPQRWVG
jgi:hypothetical protein